MLHFLSHGDAATIAETPKLLDDVDQDSLAAVPAPLLQATSVEKHVAYSPCVFHGHSVTTDPYCAPGVLRTPNNALGIIVTNM